MPTSTYLFQLGHQPLLSAAEIRTILAQQNIAIQKERFDKNLLEIATNQPLDIEPLNHRLGGTVKIMEASPTISLEIPSLADYLEATTPGKIIFSLSGPDAARRAIAIKKELKTRGRSVRYIEIKNTATILHNDLVASASDLTICNNQIFVTRAIQPLEAFSERDYGRPGTDSRSGMLPPKLARLMINLAGVATDKILLDPFCGSGTLLIEAIDLGFKNVIGTDIAARAIADSTKNIDWYNKANKTTFKPKLMAADVHTLLQKIQPKSVDAIVTEPFLGQPLRGFETKEQLTQAARALRLLYEAAFGVFAQILKPGGTVIFIIPEFYAKNEAITVDCLSHITGLGLKIIPLDSNDDSLLYRRPSQYVGRRIWKFTKN